MTEEITKTAPTSTTFSAPSPRPRVVFIDVDGTLIGRNQLVSSTVVEAIRKARSGGHKFFICTGRAVSDIPEEVTSIGFDGVVANGGAHATVGDTVVVSRMMERKTAERLLEYGKERGLGLIVQTAGRSFADQRAVELGIEHERQHLEALKAADPQARAFETAVEPKSEPQSATFTDRLKQFPRLEEIDPNAVVKAVYVSEKAEDFDVMRRELGPQFHVIDGSLPTTAGSSAEICMAGITKGYAIEEVMTYLGKDTADAVGIGDSWNDFEMFQVVGDAFAMGNADPELKKHANHQTASVAEDGVAKALESLSLLS